MERESKPLKWKLTLTTILSSATGAILLKSLGYDDWNLLTIGTGLLVSPLLIKIGNNLHDRKLLTTTEREPIAVEQIKNGINNQILEPSGIDYMIFAAAGVALSPLITTYGPQALQYLSSTLLAQN